MAARTGRVVAIYSGSGGMGGSCSLQTSDRSCRLLRKIPSWLAFATWCRASPTNGSCCGRNFCAALRRLEEFDLAYDILIYTKHLPVAAEFVRQFPRQRFVLDHLAKPLIRSGSLQPWARGIQELAAFPNVFCKLSGMVTEADWQRWKPENMTPYLDVAFECFGPKRLMIGSDWPVCTVAASTPARWVW